MLFFMAFLFFVDDIFSPSARNTNDNYDAIINRDKPWFNGRKIFQKNHKFIDHIKLNSRIIAQQGAFILFQGDEAEDLPAVDLTQRRLAELCSQISPTLVPVVSAAAAILEESATPRVYLGGEPFLLDWPQLQGGVQQILTLLNDEAAAARLITAPAEGTSVLLGEDMDPRIPGLSVVSCRYLAGGGLFGSVALVGPTRMPFSKVIPLLEAFADELGEGMAGKRKEAPQAAVPRRTRHI